MEFALVNESLHCALPVSGYTTLGNGEPVVADLAEDFDMVQEVFESRLEVADTFAHVFHSRLKFSVGANEEGEVTTEGFYGPLPKMDSQG